MILPWKMVYLKIVQTRIDCEIVAKYVGYFLLSLDNIIVY